MNCFQVKWVISSKPMNGIWDHWYEYAFFSYSRWANLILFQYSKDRVKFDSVGIPPTWGYSFSDVSRSHHSFLTCTDSLLKIVAPYQGTRIFLIASRSNAKVFHAHAAHHQMTISAGLARKRSWNHGCGLIIFFSTPSVVRKIKQNTFSVNIVIYDLFLFSSEIDL